jgi:aminoglycoside phosphotransferase (APT) family kinase protein
MLQILQQACEAAFPDRRDLRVGELTPLPAGWETDISVFTITYTEDGQPGTQRLVLRVFPGVDQADKSGREFYALQRLHRVGFPVPQVYYLGTLDGTSPRPFMLMDYIEGTPLSMLINQASEAERQALFTCFCTTLADLHRLDWRQCISVPGPSAQHNPYAFVDSFLTLIDDARQTTEAPAALDILAATETWLRTHRNDVPCQRFCALHKDYHPGNVIVRPDGSFCVIDWSQFGIGDPRYDLAWTSMHFDNPIAHSRLLECYQEAMGEEIDHFNFFEVLAAGARLYVIATLIQHGAASINLHPVAQTRAAQDPHHIRHIYDIFTSRTNQRLPAVEAMIENLENQSSRCENRD